LNAPAEVNSNINKSFEEKQLKELDAETTMVMFIGNSNDDDEDFGGFSEIYESLIDDLLDLSELSFEISKASYNDSSNLILISRCIVMVDLVHYLNDEPFFENSLFKLCTSIHDIVVKVIFFF